MADTVLKDPLKRYKFSVVISSAIGLARGGFSKVGPLKGTYEESKYREGGDGNSPRKSPGQMNWPDITLERGAMYDNDLWNLFILAANGNSNFRFEMTITENDPTTGVPVKGWSVTRCWGKDITVADLDAMNTSDPLIESLIVAHEGISPISV